MRTKTDRTPKSSGWLARAGLVLIFTMMCTTFMQGGWLQPNAANAETLSVSGNTAIATSPKNDTAAYVVMQRFVVTSNTGGTNDGVVVLNSITLDDNTATATAYDAVRVYLSTTATTTIPADAVEIGRNSADYTGASTVISLTGGATADRTVATGTPGYIYIVYDMAPGQAPRTALSRVTAMTVVSPDTFVSTGLPFSSSTITLAAGGAKATVITCFDCHGDGVNSNSMDGARSAATGSFIGSHNKHVGSLTYACTVCHSGGALTTTNMTHRNGYINIANPIYSGTGAYSKASGPTYSFAQSSNPTMGTCSTIYCHSNGVGTYSTATWGGGAMPATCTGCHGNNSTSGAPIASNAHTSHINSIGNVGRLLNCGDCHNATVSAANDRSITGTANHVNSLLNIKFDNGAGLNRDADAPTYNTQSTTTTNGAAVTPGTYGACNNVYCHSSGNLTAAGGTIVVSGTVPTFKQPDWNTTAVGCSGCHGDGAGKSHPVYTGTSAGTTTANSHVKHVEGSGLGCAYCHTGTVGTNTTTTPVSMPANALHLNRTEDVGFLSVGGKTGSYNPAVGTKTCSTTYCHGGSTPAWGGAALNCAGCHEASNVLSTGATSSNRHNLHYATATTATVITTANSSTAGGYVYGCGNCHDAGQISHAGGPAGTVYAEVKFNIVLSGATPTTGTYTVGTSTLADSRAYVYSQNNRCNSVYCHSNGAPWNLTATYATVTWNQALATPTNCNICHAAAPTTNRHDTHVGTYNMVCSQCHTATVASGSTVISDKSHHVDGNKDVNFASAVTSTTLYDSANHRCSNIYCHSQGTSSTTFNASYSIASVSVVAWNGTALNNCNECHTGGTATGPTYVTGSPKANSHAKHVTTTTGVCYQCHYATTTTGTSITNFANHADKSYDILASGGAASFSATAGNFTTPTSCTNISCHGGTGTSATWGTTLTCASCHMGTGDVNDYVYNNGITARIDSAQWGYSGHGKASGTYDSTANAAANFTGRAGTGDQCLYCHTSSVNHGDAVDFFRLRSFASVTYGKNGVCLDCHGTGAAGVNPFSGSSQTITSTNKINKYHYGSQHATTLSGGQFCWDCHDPHGESTSTAGPIVMFQSRPASVSNAVTGIPTTIVTSTVTFTSQTGPVSYATMTAPFDRVCNVCHTYKAADPYKMVHYTSTTSDGHNATTTCTQCHQHSSDTTYNGEAFKGAGGCNGCHDYDTVAGVWGKNPQAVEGFGAHAKHIDHLKGRFTITLSPLTDQFGTGAAAALCGTCHTNSAANHSMGGGGTRSINFGDGTYRANGAAGFSFLFGAATPTYSGIVGNSSAVNPKTCSNISCHFQTTPLWQSY